jgi:hypothetical protein
MKHTLVKMTNPQGEVIEIAETKVKKMLNRGWTMDTTKPTKTIEPEMVQIEEDSHEEIDHDEEKV